MTREKINSNLNYFLSSIDRIDVQDMSFTHSLLEKINAFLEEVALTPTVTSDEGLRKKIILFLTKLKESAEDILKEDKNAFPFLLQLYNVMNTFMDIFAKLKKKEKIDLDVVEEFIRENGQFFSLFSNAFFSLQDKLYDYLETLNERIIKEFLEKNQKLSQIAIIYYAMKKKRMHEKEDIYITFLNNIPRALYIEDTDSKNPNDTICINIKTLLFISEAILEKNGLERVYKDAKYDWGLKKLAISLHEYDKEKEIYRYDYYLSRCACEELLKDLKILNITNFHCYEEIINEKIKDLNIQFYKIKMGIRISNSVKEQIGDMLSKHKEDKKITEMLYRLENHLEDKGEFSLSSRETRKGIIILLLEYLDEKVYGKAHQNLLSDALSIDEEALIDKYISKSNVLRELIKNVTKNYSKVEIIKCINSLDERENLKKVLDKLLKEEDKLYNLNDLDIFEEIINVSFAYFKDKLDTYLLEAPSLAILSVFDDSVSIEALDEILEKISEPAFLEVYKNEVSKMNPSIHPNISEAFKQYRMFVSKIQSIYLKVSKDI